MKSRMSPAYLVLCLFVYFCCRSMPAGAQGERPIQKKAARPALRQSSAPGAADLNAAQLWPPTDVDKFVPTVISNPPCSLPEVLSGASHRIEELVHNLDRFTATEIVQHQKVDGGGRLRAPEFRNFNYLVSLAQAPSGYLNVEEYRRGRNSGADEFPDHVATEGTPSLVLIFHPRYIKNFSVTCEGLGEWGGKPAWQVRFEQRRDAKQSMVAMIIGGRAYGLKLRGRAWILASSHQVARLETDLAETIPRIHLSLDHQSVEYRPVRFPDSKVEIWLPASTELFMDFQGHRFYRRHTFTDFNLFSVRIDQQFGEPR
jgi:hypothetical protein